MVSNPMDVSGSLKQKGTHWETLRDIRQDLLLMDSLKG